MDMLEYLPNETLLKGKTILVTGAGKGIGREIACQYAAKGATVILLGRTIKTLEQVYDAILAAGGPTPAIIPLDLQGATEENYRDMAQTIEEQFGRLDGVVHNAALLGTLSPIGQIDIDEFGQVMHVNVTAQLMLTKALLPLMAKSPSASIIFTSSGVGRKGRAFWGSYAISKFATEGMMQTLADELDGTTIRANCINPGATRTSMRASAFPAEDPNSLRTPAEIMTPYLYLMGDDGKDINGQSLDAQPKRK